MFVRTDEDYGWIVLAYYQIREGNEDIIGVEVPVNFIITLVLDYVRVFLEDLWENLVHV